MHRFFGTKRGDDLSVSKLMAVAFWVLLAVFVTVTMLMYTNNVGFTNYAMRVRANQLALLVNLVSSAKTDVTLPFSLPMNEYYVDFYDGRVEVYEGGTERLMQGINFFSSEYDVNLNLKYKEMALAYPQQLYVLKKGNEVSINYEPKLPEYAISPSQKDAVENKLSCAPVDVGFKFEEINKIVLCDTMEGFCTPYAMSVVNSIRSKAGAVITTNPWALKSQIEIEKQKEKLGQDLGDYDLKKDLDYFVAIISGSSMNSRVVKAKVLNNEHAVISKYLACMTLNLIYDKNPEAWLEGISTEKDELTNAKNGLTLDIEFFSLEDSAYKDLEVYEDLGNVKYGFVLELPDGYLPYSRVSEAFVQTLKNEAK
jgi:hypothetical protein